MRLSQTRRLQLDGSFLQEGVVCSIPTPAVPKGSEFPHGRGSLGRGPNPGSALSLARARFSWGTLTSPIDHSTQLGISHGWVFGFCFVLGT